MPTHDELVALREMVRNAKGKDREIDLLVWKALGAKRAGWFWKLPGDAATHYSDLPEITSSLDAAVALCERLFAEQGWCAGSIPLPWARIGPTQDSHHYGRGQTVPLALIAACLTALIAQQEVADAPA